ncbi:MAG: YwqG family protein [Lysinibacillus sp.]
MNVPKELEVYRETITNTMEPFVKVTLSKETVEATSSKVGGHPYFLKDAQYPVNKEGKPLHLLAQINFAEVMKFSEDFPESGILQFFIDGHDDVIGMNLEEPTRQEGFLVIYHEQVEEDGSERMQDFSFLGADDEVYLPFLPNEEFKMHFEKTKAPVSISDFRIEQENIEFDEALWEAYEETYSSQGHKIGGYPYFTQNDPREDERLQDKLLLLFQLDSDGDHDIMWGDMGVGNFFISKEDLRKRNFSDVLYNWDCC